MLIAVVPAGAANEVQNLPIPVDISHRLKDRPAPEQPYMDAVHLPSGGSTSESVCPGGTDDFIVITIPSFDPANPESQDVVFWKESVGTSATLWVAWDYLVTHFGREDTITCDQLASLQGEMDSIVDVNVHYFGDYVERPAGNTNIDVMIYNIVDESFFDDAFPFYIAGFFWSSLNITSDRNMIFIDSLDWENRLGPDAAIPYLYEGTVAHELEHLIHFDHDADEESWIDEGMADLAEYLNGFGHPQSHVVYYLAFHRTSLTVWGGGLEDYGASYLFQLYLLENFGTMDGSYSTGWSNSWTRKLIDEADDSIVGVEDASGAVFDELFDAWVVANYVDDPNLSTGSGFPIGYDEIDLTPYVSTSFSPWSIERAIDDIYGAGHHGALPVDRYYGGFVSGTVEYPVGELAPYTPLYGAYKGIQPEMNILLLGAAQSGVAPNSGTYEVASGGGHLLTDRTLTLQQSFDTTSESETLSFATWYDIETEWDYGFVEVSNDGGSTWYPIPGSITSESTNPNGSTAWANALGTAASSDTVITGNSGGWVAASFDLPSDDDLQIRFNYYTDEAANGQGWFIDDVAVSAGAFSDGFEGGGGNWTLGGWTITTGLFNNDWLVAYTNPVHTKGQFDYLEFGFIDLDIPNGPYEVELGSVDTNKLKNQSAMVVIANRPGENPFASGYTLLVDKGDAGK
jgi:hypothetical protein